jgi:hypothetical protein
LRTIIVLRVLLSAIGLYICGDPAFTSYKPVEIETLSRTVYLVFEPLVQEARQMAGMPAPAKPRHRIIHATTNDRQ